MIVVNSLTNALLKFIAILATMYVINFLIAILMPFIGLFYLLAPPNSIPVYFASDAAAFMAGEFYVVVFYWAGLLRNSVDRGQITERQYFGLMFSVLLFMCFSKIVFALPYTWIISIFAFGLGVLSATRGQWLGKKSLIILLIISAVILAYTGFILLGMAWFGFTPAVHEYYIDNVHGWINDWID